jgi:segregation and condensation protein A
VAFRVQLDDFRGPLDLLLYLVRKHEVDIVELPVAEIAEQFLGYVEVLEQLDVNAVGEFLEMASTLAEIKSRLVLPHGGETDEPLEDPRQDLVRQLLEYKQFRDAASMLEERSRAWQEHFPRLANDLPPRRRDPAEEPIHEVELWDLVSALGRVLREQGKIPGASILYDDTPIHVYMTRIQQQVAERGRVAFSELFQPHMHKSTLVGMFLAILELVRHHDAQTEQDALFGEIWVLPGPPVDGDAPRAAEAEFQATASSDDAASAQAKPTPDATNPPLADSAEGAE